jgi:plasmid stabilization system protein ParE
MSRIRITPLAEQDLVEIWYFIAQDDPVAADRLLDLLEEQYELLADNPHMGPAQPDMLLLDVVGSITTIRLSKVFRAAKSRSRHVRVRPRGVARMRQSRCQ